MALQSQLMPLPFQTGLSQKVDSRWVDIGSQTTVTNCVMRKAGALQKRQGYTALSTQTLPDTGSITAGKRLGEYGQQLTMIDGTNYYGYNVTAAKWRQADMVPTCDAFRDPVAEWPSGMISFDCAYGSGYLVVAWTAKELGGANNRAYCSVIDWATGTYIVQNQQVLVGIVVSYVRVVISGTTVMFFGVDDSATQNIQGQTLNLSTMAFGAVLQVVTDHDTTAHGSMWDVCPIANDTGAVLLYPYKNGPTLQTAIALVPTSLVVTVSTNFAKPAGMTSPGFGYAVCATAMENIFFMVGYQNGAGNTEFHVGSRDPSTLVQVLAETTTGVIFTGTTRCRTGIVRLSGTACAFVMSNATASIGMRWGQMNTSGTVSGTARNLYYHQLGCKPFVQGGKTYVTAVAYSTLTAYVGTPPTSQSSPQGAHVLIDLDTGNSNGTQQAGRPCAYTGPRISNVTNVSFTTNPVAVGSCAVSSTQWITAGSFAGALAGNYRLNAITYDFNPAWDHVQLGDTAYVGGGVVTQYDGKAVTEVGFLHPPHNLAAAPVAGGALTANGAYTYLAVYQWTDGAGQVQRSAAAITSITLTGANQQTTLTLGNCLDTRKQDYENSFTPPIVINVYRNQAGGSTFYQLFADTALPNSTPNTYTQTIGDNVSDAALVSNNYGIWPSQGGALEGYAPPALSVIIAHNNRLWGIGDDRTTLWYSSEVVVGEQVHFNDSWQIVMPTSPVKALASMDGVLYAFTADRIYAIPGKGPNQFGQQSDFDDPQIVPSDVGCIDHRSVVATSSGVYFQSALGIYMLSRSREVQYVGAAIEDTLATYPVCKSAVVVPHYGEVRFALATAETAEVGVDAVYNYILQGWTLFDRYDTGTATSLKPSMDEAVVGTDYYWLTSGGQVYQENKSTTATNANTDNGHWVTMTVESAWAKADGIAGWGRFRYANLVAQRSSPHDISISVATDYSTTYSQTGTFTALQMSAWTTPLQHAELQVGNQKASALRVKITDSSPTGIASTTGAGPVLVGLQLDVGVYGRVARIPPTQGA